jgi:4-hydroxybutyrate dehydrogenase
MEIYLSPLNHAFSNVFCAEGTRLIVRNYKRIIDKGPEERLNHLKEFLRASAYGGIGLSHNTCGAVHACSMYFGGVHHTPHGLTNSLFLGPVMKLYAKKAPEGTFLKDLAKIICTEMEIEADTKGTFKALDKMIDSILPREKLRTFGMPADSSYKYAQNVLDPNRQKRILDNNYVSLSVEEVANLFDELY